MKKFKKLLATVMVASMVFGTVPAWGTPYIRINANGTTTLVKDDGSTEANPYSNTSYFGMDGKVATIGEDVVNSITTDGSVSGGNLGVMGIYVKGSTSLKVDSLVGGITVSSTGSANGIWADSTCTGNIIVNKLGNILVNGSHTSNMSGIYSMSNATISVGFIEAGGTIEVTNEGKSAFGISTNGGTTKVTNLKSIDAHGGMLSIGISVGSNATNTSITFTDSGGSITATSDNSGAKGIEASATKTTSTTTVTNLDKITATGKVSSGGTATHGIYASGKSTTVTFAGDTRSIEAKVTGTGTGDVYGIFTRDLSTTHVGTDADGNTGKELKTITAEGVNGAYGIGALAQTSSKTSTVEVTNTTKVAFAGGGSSISAKSSSGKAYGINATAEVKSEATQNASTNLTVTGLDKITSEVTGGTGAAYGIYTATVNKGTGTTATASATVTFAGDNRSIEAKITGEGTGEAYGISASGTGTTTVSNLTSIKAEGVAGAYGISASAQTAEDQTNAVTNEAKVSFTGDGSSITAKSNAEAYGIYADAWVKTGTNNAQTKLTVEGLDKITSEVTDNDYTAYGIYTGATKESGAGGTPTVDATVTFAGDNRSITATSSGGNAYGISASGNGKTYVGTDKDGVADKELTSITATGATNAYGIYSNGSVATFANNVNFKGNGGQAITATATDAANAYSIYAAGNGATTVNFENSILSGKVAQSGDATLSLNINDKGVWTVKDGDVTGAVSVNVNSGGTLDTRTRDAAGKVTTAATKTINLGTGTFTAQSGSIISFDAITAPNGLTTDQIKAATTSTGTIALGTVNVADTATKAWSEAKSANLFVDASGNPLGITITGTTVTDTDNGYRYTFTGGANGKVSVTSVKGTTYSLPAVIQADPKEAGEADTFSLTANYTLNKDLGTLNNSYRKSGKREFTIAGNDNTLDGDGKKGVTINAGDTLNVTNLKVKGFAQPTTGTGSFATNSGTLNLNNVTFEHATGRESEIDIYNNAGATFVATGTFNGNVYNAGTDSKVELADGATLSSTVQGNGSIVVTGTDTKNTADQTLDVIVKETKDLTTTKKLAGNITLEKDAELTATEAGAEIGSENKKITVGKNATLTALADNIKADIYNASDHSVHLTGGTLNKNIYQGGTTYIEGDTPTTFANGITVANKVYLDNGTSLSAGSLFNLTNTLYFEGGASQSSIDNIKTTGTLAFVLTGANKNQAIVQTTNSYAYDLTGAKVALYHNKKQALYAKQDVIKLMKGTSGSYTGGETLADGSILKYKYKTYMQGDELLAQYLGVAGVAEEAKSFSEGFLAGIATLTQANDLVSDAAIASAKTATETAPEQKYTPYVAIQGGHGRYNSGSHIDINTTMVAAGVAKKFSDSTIGGLLIEGGNGRYTTYNEFASGNIRADGEVKYYGAGIFGRHAFRKNDKGNAYLDAAFSAGRSNQDYRTSYIMDVSDYHYDTGVTYLKAHATAGYEWHLKKASLDGYVKYLWSHQNGATINFNGQDVSLDGINSHRLRIGARYTQKIRKTFAWYGGLAYEYEFDAKAGASSMGFAIAAPDLKGGSGMAELGLKYVPQKADEWLFDLGLQGFTGKKDTLSFRLAAWYTF